MDILSIFPILNHIYYVLYDAFWGAEFYAPDNAIVQFLFVTIVLALYVFTVVFTFRLVLRFFKYLWRLI